MLAIPATSPATLHWGHNERDGVSINQPHDCSRNRLFRRRSKKTSKLRATGLWVGISPIIGEFPPQMASNAENVIMDCICVTVSCGGLDAMSYTIRWLIGCKDGDFKCGRGHCIPYFYTCDGNNDCGDLSDKDSILCGRTSLVTIDWKRFIDNSGYHVLKIDLGHVLLEIDNTVLTFIPDYINLSRNQEYPLASFLI